MLIGIPIWLNALQLLVREYLVLVPHYGLSMTFQCYNIHLSMDLDRRWINSHFIYLSCSRKLIDLSLFLGQFALTNTRTQETDTALSIIGVITNVVDHIYYPIEKICWLAEHKAITVDDLDRWDTISSIFWVSSIYLNLMR